MTVNGPRVGRIASREARLDSSADTSAPYCTIQPFAAKRSTATIPIVMTVSSDPAVGSSPVRPGGKRLELLKELLPRLSRVTVRGMRNRGSIHGEVRGRERLFQSFRSAGSFPPCAASLVITCLCSQTFMVAESLVSPV